MSMMSANKSLHPQQVQGQLPQQVQQKVEQKSTDPLYFQITVNFENSSEYEETNMPRIRGSSPPLCPVDIEQPMDTEIRGRQQSRFQTNQTQEDSQAARAARARQSSQEQRTAMHNRMRETTSDEQQSVQDLVDKIKAMKDEITNIKGKMDELSDALNDSNIESYQNHITNVQDIKEVMQIITREKESIYQLGWICISNQQMLMEMTNKMQQQNQHQE